MKYFYTRLQLHSCVLSTLWIWHFNKIYLNQNTYKYNCSIPAQTLPWGSHLPSLNCSFWSDSWSLITFLVSQSRWTRQHPTAAMNPPLLAGTTNVTMSSEKNSKYAYSLTEDVILSNPSNQSSQALFIYPLPFIY